jgi:hypothetical protein
MHSSRYFFSLPISLGSWSGMKASGSLKAMRMKSTICWNFSIISLKGKAIYFIKNTITILRFCLLSVAQ